MKHGTPLLLSLADDQWPVARYRATVEQAVRAESLGFESVWPVEHHLNPAVSISPCPTLLLAAIAERTTRLRLGTAIGAAPAHAPAGVAGRSRRSTW